MNNRLFVGNLDYGTHESDLRQAFEAFGEVVSASVVTDRETGRSRGFGFVEFQSSTDAERAVSSLNNSLVNGRAMNVSVARERGAGGGGGGAGRGGADGSRRDKPRRW